MANKGTEHMLKVELEEVVEVLEDGSAASGGAVATRVGGDAGAGSGLIVQDCVDCKAPI